MTTGQVGFVQCNANGQILSTGGGGGGGGAVTIADGADVAEGSTVDAASTAGGAGSVSAKLRLVTTQLGTLATALSTINTTLGSPFQAGGSIGNTTLAVTQGTSPWVVSGTVTANFAANQSVNVAQVNGVTTQTGAGAVGAGSIRTAVGQDTTTIAGSAPGTAGSASTNVVTVQGVTSMTPVQVSQATAANLNATVVGTGTFATQSTLAAETTKVIGTVNQGTSPWVISGAVTNAGTFAVQAAGAVNTTLTDCSGAITSGATAQNAFTAAATRHGFTIANIDTSEVLWISFTTTAAASGTGSYPLAPATATTFTGLSSFTSPIGMGINTALSVIAATTAHKFSCTVW